MTREPLPSVEELMPQTIPAHPPVPEGMRTFTVYRQADESGISGTGKVIQGVLFANGTLCIQWLCGPDPGDTQIKRDWEKFLDTHVRSHKWNRTVLTFDNKEQIVFETPDFESELTEKQ